jgi:hypothetical protein
MRLGWQTGGKATLVRDARLAKGGSIMRQLENDTVARAGAAPHAGIGPLLEVAAINIAWPLCLIRFGTGIVTGQPMNALQGLLLFALVVLYTLIRLSQAGRSG